MKYNPGRQNRRSIRLRDYDYSQSGAYFVTICAWGRECLFGDILIGEMVLSKHGEIVKEYFEKTSQHFQNIKIDCFVIMPNHIHAIIIIEQPVGVIHELPLQVESALEIRKQRRSMMLPRIIGWFKMNSAKAINKIREVSGRPLWQRNYYEHIIRNETTFEQIRQYIRNNPLEWELDENNPKNMQCTGKGNS